MRTASLPDATTSPRRSWRPRRVSTSPLTRTAPDSINARASPPDPARPASLSTCPRRMVSSRMLTSCIDVLPPFVRCPPPWRATCGRSAIPEDGVEDTERVAGSDAQVLELAGREVRITTPGKVLFAERGETKLDLVHYYAAVAEPLLRAMGGRPVLMQRFPQGAGGSSFFQKRVPDSAPEWLQTTTVQTVNGTPSRALVAADVAHVAWAVNLACLGFHVWPYRAHDADHADELRLDLDPQPGTGFAEARAAATELKALLDELGIVGFPKTTGNRGLHVYVRLEPRWDSYAVRFAAVAAARELERRRPDILTAGWWKEERGRRIFVDYNQNAPHKTVFGAWSVRARAGAQVSTPVRWEELD